MSSCDYVSSDTDMIVWKTGTVEARTYKMLDGPWRQSPPHGHLQALLAIDMGAMGNRHRRPAGAGCRLNTVGNPGSL